MLLAFLGALAIGISLGLLGSGGSILTMPVLLFFLHRPDKLAVAESLAIVGGVALVGALPYAWRGQVHLRSVFYFGLTGMLGAYLGALASRFVSGEAQVTAFGLIMLVAAGMMLFGPKLTGEVEREPHPIWRIMADGFLVGSLTGFLGVGGGFLIVPALVLLGSLSMHLAVGTSLVIIAMNAFTGFVEQLAGVKALQMDVSWPTIALVAIVGICGSLFGGHIGSKLSQTTLRNIFALFIALIGICMLLRESGVS